MFGIFCVWHGVCVCRQVQPLYLSMWDVTKHGGWSPSQTGINWVSDGVGINSTEYMHHKSVYFSGSLERTTVIGFWGRNGAIPVRTKLLLLSNRLQGFWWDRTILDGDFSVHAVVSTYTSMSVTKAFRIFMDQKLVSTNCERVSPMQLWCKRKRWGFFSTGGYLYLYLCLLYKALVNMSQKWKRWKRDAGEDETPCVWCMCVLIPRSVISLSCGGSCSFLRW